MALSLCACDFFERCEPDRVSRSEQDGDGEAETSAPEKESTGPETSPTQPEHSEYFIPGYSTEDVIGYFSEVVLDIENKADPDSLANQCVKKWDSEIIYQISGEYTEADLAVLRDFMEQLRQVAGMPRITEAGDADLPNFTITFCDLDAFTEACPGTDEFTNGYVSIWWYNDNLEVFSAEIYIRSDIDQTTRSRTIRHEVYQGLGMLQDSAREDSIIYLADLQADEMSEMDLLIVTLLYHQDIELGMNGEECAGIIRELYE